MYILMEKQTNGDYNESQELEPVFVTDDITIAICWENKEDLDPNEHAFYVRDVARMTVLEDEQDFLRASEWEYKRGIYK